MRALLALTLVVLLAACAPQSGNYVRLNNAATKQIVGDIVQKLTELHPPATTHILLSHAAADSFGDVLEKKLRESGYAVESSDGLDWLLPTSDTKPALAKPTSRKAAKTKVASATQKAPILPKAPSAKNLSVSYVIDHIEGKLYRVMVKADNQVLSRVYTVSDQHLTPAGVWALRE